MSRVFVTGCSSGIGRATAELLQRRGHAVVASARALDSIADLAVEATVALNVTSAKSVAAAAPYLSATEVLVNNAGATLAAAPVESIPEHALEEILQTNVIGPLRMAKAVLPGMRARRRGKIINISSVSAHRGNPLLGAYTASKAALDALSEALRLEVAHLGIMVCCVEPAGVRTRFGSNAFAPDPTDEAYAPVRRAMRLVFEGYNETRIPASTVAGQVAALVAQAEPELRNPVGPAAARLLGERRALSDAEYERTFSKLIGECLFQERAELAE